MRSAALIAVVAVTTIMLRFLPFIVFRKETPPYITYLGKVLPEAIIGMLVIVSILLSLKEWLALLTPLLIIMISILTLLSVLTIVWMSSCSLWNALTKRD